MKATRISVLAVLAALVIGITSPATSFAQDKMGGKMDGGKMGGKMMAPVYVSKGSKMAYTESQAKMMGMKDKMGMKLVKMAKMPTGYKMAPANKMDGGKMGGKMDGGKMGGKMAPSPAAP